MATAQASLRLGGHRLDTTTPSRSVGCGGAARLPQTIVVNQQISPKFTAVKLTNATQGDRLDIFEDRIRGWILAPAEVLLGIPNFRIASLCLLLTYFEGTWSYKTGLDSKNRSKEFFRAGFVDVFRHTKTDVSLLGRGADILYDDARCGFFHDGMFRSRIFFTSRGWALEFTVPKVGGVLDLNGEIQSIMIDPRLFFDAVVEHFSAYMKHLRDGSDAALLENFETAWNTKHAASPIVAIDDAKAAT
jgi:hypothetical protein